MKAEETKDINVTFPEQYHAKDLAGKDAVFTVTVHEVKEKQLPELDDEFAVDTASLPAKSFAWYCSGKVTLISFVSSAFIPTT